MNAFCGGDIFVIYYRKSHQTARHGEIGRQRSSSKKVVEVCPLHRATKIYYWPWCCDTETPE